MSTHISVPPQLLLERILTLEIVPAIYSLWRGRQVEWVKGPKPARKSWDDLSEQFRKAEAVAAEALDQVARRRLDLDQESDTQRRSR